MSTMNDEAVFNRNKDIQEMINAFLALNHMPTIAERLAADGKSEVDGVLTADHKIILQQIIKLQYPDIDSRIRDNDGRGQILGAISATEAELTGDLLEQYYAQRDLDQADLVQARTY